MKILKLAKAEMKKIYSRPSIFIMAFILILVLAGSSLVYGVPNRDDEQVFINGSNVGEVYSNYLDQTKIESRARYNQMYNSASSLLDTYRSPTTAITDLENAYAEIDSLFTDYGVNINTNAPDTTIDSSKQALRASIVEFKDLYNSLYGNAYPQILIEENNHIKLLQFLDTYINTIIIDNAADNTIILNNLANLNFLNEIQSKLDTIKPFIVSAERVNFLDYIDTQLNERLDGIDDQLLSLNEEKGSSQIIADIYEINSLITEYKLSIVQFDFIATNSVYLDVFENTPNITINSYVGFDDLDLYKLQEEYTKNLYLFNNNDFAFNYATPFNVSTSSNTTPNAFDFSHFTLELFSFIILIYVVVLGAGMIAGEQANGTLKLLAIRPYKRYKIFLAKILASLNVAFMFLIIGATVTFITGTFLYSSSSLPILSVFNANTVIIMSPFEMLAIFLITLLIEILFYVILATAISTIFKSYTGSVTISILIYFMSMIVNIFTSGGILKYIPLSHTGLFKYFGTAYLNTFSQSGLDSLVNSPIFPDTNVMFSSAMIFGTIAILLITALKVFTKRDLT